MKRIAIHIETTKIAKEILDVLVKNKVPVIALDDILECVKDMTYTRTLIQNEKEIEEAITLEIDAIKLSKTISETIKSSLTNHGTTPTAFITNFLLIF